MENLASLADLETVVPQEPKDAEELRVSRVREADPDLQAWPEAPDNKENAVWSVCPACVVRWALWDPQDPQASRDSRVLAVSAESAVRAARAESPDPLDSQARAADR